MQTRKDVAGQVAGLVGDPMRDWLTDEYLSPLINTAYEQAIMYLEGSCSPYIEKVVMVPSVPIGPDESNLVPFASPENVYPLGNLVEPRYVDFRVSGTTGPWRPVQVCTILPDTPPQVVEGTFDIRVRGDFRPAVLTSDDSVIEIHPLAAHALAYSVGALIGMERPNEGWVTNYGQQAKDAWNTIAGKLSQQQQGQTFRLGSPNRGNGRDRNQWNFNLQGNMAWEWRSFGLYLKLI
jgi:hypothetical protein